MNCPYLLINRNIFGYSDVHVRLERIKLDMKLIVKLFVFHVIGYITVIVMGVFQWERSENSKIWIVYIF